MPSLTEALFVSANYFKSVPTDPNQFLAKQKFSQLNNFYILGGVGNWA